MPYETEDGLQRIIAEVAHRGNRDRLNSYIEERRANGMRLGTLLHNANAIRSFALFLGERPFESTTREDVRDFVNQRYTTRRWRNGETETSKKVKIGTTTQNIRKTVLKAFMRWLRGTEEYPPEVKWLKPSRSQDEDRLPVDQILTREELLALIQAQDHQQHKAIFATLYDTGCRASEFISFRIRDVSLDQYGAVLTLPKGARGLKTGARRIRVLNCTPYLRAWLNAHPRRNDPSAPLWISYANRNHGAPLTANALYTLVVRAGPAAGLKKEIWPHLLRHSRATEAAREGWNEAEMRAYFGWKENSDMPSRYVHLSGKDYEENMLRRAGKLPGGFRPEAALKPRVCEFCSHENAATAEFCENKPCGAPLTALAAAKRERAAQASLLASIQEDEKLFGGLVDAVLAKGHAVALKRAARKH